MNRTERGFDGLRVLALESRRAADMARLIENHGGAATVAPSMREVEHENLPEVLAFERMLLAGELDGAIFMTGVGTRMLAREIEARLPREVWVQALASLPIAARGPKPALALRELGVPVALNVPEPNTWRELLATLDANPTVFPLEGRRVALQEYGMINRALLEGLQARGAIVVRVPVYRWDLPEDVEPLRRAVQSIAAGEQDVALFTTGTQVWHLFKVAAEMGLESALRDGLKGMVIASIGPTCSESLREFELPIDLEPEHPKMGHLVKHAAGQSHSVLAGKGRKVARQAGT